MKGVGKPNDVGAVPPDLTIDLYEYAQVEDLVAGGPIQIWYWNVNLQVWQ